MFEPPQSKEKSGGAALYIIIAIVVVVVAGGAWAYMNSKGSATSSAPAPTTAATPQANADPVHDLRVVSTSMEKDLSGTTAVWTVELENQSSTYTYSNIGYETTYAGRDSTVLAQNQGTIPSLSLGPGESQQTQFNDTQYPTGTVLFRIRITGATATR